MGAGTETQCLTSKLVMLVLSVSHALQSNEYVIILYKVKQHPQERLQSPTSEPSIATG